MCELLKMLHMLYMKLSLVMLVILLGIANVVVSQSLPEPVLFNRGCRAPRGQFPHETYCQQYYNCWDGRASIEECPGKLLFNPVIQACDYPEAVNCGGRLRNPEPAVTADGRCLKQFGTFPDQTDCTAFYKCSHGRAYRQICPYYTAFDDRYLVCVHAYEVECGGRGGVYGTLAPPTFSIPDAGTLSRIGVSSGGGSSPTGWDRRKSHQPSGSAAVGTQTHPPTNDAATGTGGRRDEVGSRGGISRGSGNQESAAGGRGGTAARGGTATRGDSSSTSTSDGAGTSSGTTSGNLGGSTGRVSSESGTSSRGIGSGGASGGTTGTRGGIGSSSGTHAGIVGIVDKDISPTGRERQYEKPISPETTFRCPHPRGLYPNALDCSRFWLCREYKPSLLKCPTGQLFDLASLSCVAPEKAQCSSISSRT